MKTGFLLLIVSIGLLLPSALEAHAIVSDWTVEELMEMQKLIEMQKARERQDRMGMGLQHRMEIMLQDRMGLKMQDKMRMELQEEETGMVQQSLDSNAIIDAITVC